MTYEWEDSNGVQHVTAWSKAVRNAMLRGRAEYQVQRVLDRAGTNWNKNFLLPAYAGRQSIRQSASEGVQSDLMGAKDWGRRAPNPPPPPATSSDARGAASIRNQNTPPLGPKTPVGRVLLRLTEFILPPPHPSMKERDFLRSNSFASRRQVRFT